MSETNVTVTIENLAPENGTFITPLWVGFHDGEFDTYDRGRAASPGLESLAEDGATDGISAEFLASGSGAIDAVLVGTEGVAGPIDPGEVVSQTFTLEGDDPTNRYFNYASMILPSNDAFIANGDPLGIPIFDETGNFIGADFIIYGNSVLDAGTEVNDEAESSTAFFGQTEPDTGETEDGVVQFHPGFIEGGRILSEDGSSENAVAAFNNADFTEPGYQVARISIRNDDLLPPPEDLVEVTVTVENLAPKNGTAITPLWFGLHDGNFDTYDRGRPASAGLESVAEDGVTEDIAAEFLDSGTGFVEGTITGDEGANPGVIDVGETTRFTFTVDRSLASSRYFNYASMVLPSNDAFIANGNPLAHEIFDENGNFLGADFVITGGEVLDAGTEVNDEAESSTAFFGQTAPNTGETEGGVVRTHPGFEPEGRILSSTEFSNADFTVEDYNVARITITTAAPTMSTAVPALDPIVSTASDDNTIGTDSDDELAGTEGNDGITGQLGDDVIDGSSGNDVFDGGAGNDTLNGGAGMDTAVYQFAPNSVTVILGEAEAQGIALDGFNTIDILSDIENIIASEFNDSLIGNSGNNSLTGRDGNDEISGGLGDDFITGSDGADNLTGGGGSDRFIYLSPSEGGDTITDFTQGTDKITVVSVGFGGGLPMGELSESNFVSGSGATTSEQRFIFDDASGELFYDADGSGAATPQLIATLTDSNLSAGDIMVL